MTDGATTQKAPVTSTVRVLDGCRTFRSPIDFRRTVEVLLAGIQPGFLAGLDRVVLRDADSLTREEKKKRERLSGKIVAGTYYHAVRGSAPYIDLFIDVIAARWPKTVLRVPLLREILISSVLFHELGHHIHSWMAPDRRDREVTAEAWQRRLSREFFRRRYRFLMFVFGPLGRWVRRSRQRGRGPTAAKRTPAPPG